MFSIIKIGAEIVHTGLIGPSKPVFYIYRSTSTLKNSFKCECMRIICSSSQEYAPFFDDQNHSSYIYPIIWRPCKKLSPVIYLLTIDLRVQFSSQEF